MSQDNGVFFEMVPTSYEEEAVNESSIVVNDFCERALSEGFPPDIVERAKGQAGDCKTYDDFADVIRRVLDNLDAADQKEAQRRQDVQRSIQRTIQSLSQQDIMGLIDQKIQTTYNTTAVTALELTEECAKTFTQEMLQVYANVTFAVYICMNSAWVKQAMNACLDKWETSMDTKNFVGAYLKKMGSTPDSINSDIRKLPEYLPDAYSNENSPVLYKAYMSMQLMTKKSTDIEVNDQQILQCLTYYRTLKAYWDKGTPFKAACAIATYAACKELGIKSSYGYTVLMPYTGWCLFEAALNNALGPLLDEFYAPPKVDAPSAEEEKLEQEIKANQEKRPEVKIRTTPTPVQPVVRKTTPKKRKQSVDIAPYIPKWFMATFIHIVVCLILLIFAKFFAMLSAIAFAFATVGWFNVERGTDVSGKSPYLYIAGGYVGFIACMLLYLT